MGSKQCHILDPFWRYSYCTKVKLTATARNKLKSPRSYAGDGHLRLTITQQQPLSVMQLKICSKFLKCSVIKTELISNPTQIISILFLCHHLLNLNHCENRKRLSGEIPQKFLRKKEYFTTYVQITGTEVPLKRGVGAVGTVPGRAGRHPLRGGQVDGNTEEVAENGHVENERQDREQEARHHVADRSVGENSQR